MIFSTLAICVCLAAFFLVLSGTALASWPLLRMSASAFSVRPATAARVLFAGRALPSISALSVTLGLVLPAFLRFEPHSTREAIGAKLLLLSLAGGLALLVMMMRGLRILLATAATEKRWRAGSTEQWVDVAGSPVTVTFVANGPPALLAVTGFFRPRIFVAWEVARLLTLEELSAAVAHELAHVSFFDNLKQLLVKISRPPRWTGGAALEAAWIQASEVAADEAALARGANALDLASALVKMGTLRNGAADFDRVAASHLLPAAAGSALEMRVYCLEQAIAGNLARPKITSGDRRRRQILGVMIALAAYAVAAGTLLPSIHDALEFLVR